MNPLHVSLILIFITSVFGGKLPDDFPRCHRTDPNIDECFQKVLGKAMKVIGTKGIPSINLPPLEPIVISKLVVGEGSSAVQLTQTFYNLTSIGFSDVKVLAGHLDWPNKILTFTGFGDRILQKGQYETKGHILSLPVTGKGDFEIILTNLTCTDHIQFKEVTKKGQKYFKIEESKVTLDVDNVHFDFENAFDGNSALTENINMVLNDNWRAVLDDVLNGYNQAYSEVAKYYASILFDNVPVDEIFLP